MGRLKNVRPSNERRPAERMQSSRNSEASRSRFALRSLVSSVLASHSVLCSSIVDRSPLPLVSSPARSVVAAAECSVCSPAAELSEFESSQLQLPFFDQSDRLVISIQPQSIQSLPFSFALLRLALQLILTHRRLFCLVVCSCIWSSDQQHSALTSFRLLASRAFCCIKVDSQLVAATPPQVMSSASAPSHSAAPMLCQGNCGFYGNPRTDNLCSKCHKARTAQLQSPQQNQTQQQQPQQQQQPHIPQQSAETVAAAAPVAVQAAALQPPLSAPPAVEAPATLQPASATPVEAVSASAAPISAATVSTPAVASSMGATASGARSLPSGHSSFVESAPSHYPMQSPASIYQQPSNPANTPATPFVLSAVQQLSMSPIASIQSHQLPSSESTSLSQQHSMAPLTISTLDAHNGSSQPIASGTISPTIKPLSTLHALTSSPSLSSVQSSGSSASSSVTGSKKKRCFVCSKKLVGLSFFVCKCDESGESKQFCAAHRLPHQHKCEFDHKQQHKTQITAANPIVRNDQYTKL